MTADPRDGLTASQNDTIVLLSAQLLDRDLFDPASRGDSPVLGNLSKEVAALKAELLALSAIVCGGADSANSNDRLVAMLESFNLK